MNPRLKKKTPPSRLPRGIRVAALLACVAGAVWCPAAAAQDLHPARAQASGAIRREARSPGDGRIAGRVTDATGAVIAGAEVTLRLKASGAVWTTQTGSDGWFEFAGPASGEYEVGVAVAGFGTARQIVRLRNVEVQLEFRLEPATVAQEVSVTERLIATTEDLARLPGAAELIPANALTESRVFSTEEALRRVSGVNTRGEEGFGLRPNIGVRGLNPTRSTQILLLEDGLPLAYAPYGDNASYYHPPIDRFESVEVVKGGGQILYGPRTVGAVINYLTPQPPMKPGGALTLTGGNRDYFNAHGRLGGTWKGTGLLVDYLRKQGKGARANLGHRLNDFNVKTLTALSGKQVLGLRFNAYTEDSQVTYSGLREAEYRANPRANPFVNDEFTARRYAASVRHSWTPKNALLVTTAAYGTVFNRDWWRQSSNSGQRPNDSADPNCGSMANLLTTCGNEGRLRDYYTYGVETKVRASFQAARLRQEADFGGRVHFESQDRLQKNGPLPTSRDGLVVENNLRKARAFSFFVQDRLIAGAWSFTPGVRVERVHYDRTNRLGNAGAGVSGKEDLTVAVPGFGAAYTPSERLTVFAGVHRGFAPPRVEDVISNATGASVALEPELSWNYEVGVRSRPIRAVQLEATFFRLDFENQIIPASVAGGIGATLTNGGQTLHQGVELASRVEWRNVGASRHGVYWRTAYTWLPVARFAGQRFSNVPGFSTVSITGNRLPYAPENLLTSSVGYVHTRGFNAQLEGVYTGRQFGDDLNTVVGTADGQRGLIPGYAVFNATVNVPVEGWRTTVFVSCKNLFDRLYVVDRTRGILPGAPRLVQAGLHWSF